MLWRRCHYGTCGFIPEGKRVQRVQRVQRVHRVQKVVVAAAPQIKRGRGWRRRLCRRVVWKDCEEKGS